MDTAIENISSGIKLKKFRKKISSDLIAEIENISSDLDAEI